MAQTLRKMLEHRHTLRGEVVGRQRQEEDKADFAEASNFPKKFKEHLGIDFPFLLSELVSQILL